MSPSPCSTTTSRARKGFARRCSPASCRRFTPGCEPSSKSRDRPARRWSKSSGAISITVARNRDFSKFFYSVFFGPDESPLHPAILAAAGTGGQLVHESATRAATAGLIDSTKVEALETALNAMINFWVILTIKDEAEVSREVAVQIVDVLLDGVGRD